MAELLQKEAHKFYISEFQDGGLVAPVDYLQGILYIDSIAYKFALCQKLISTNLH
jgi:hypothetical protein